MKIMAYFHISIGQDAAGAAPVIRKIEIKDIREALEEGLNDFWAMPSHAAFLGLVYPLCGMVLAYAPSYAKRPAAALSTGLRFCATRSLRGHRPV